MAQNKPLWVFAKTINKPIQDIERVLFAIAQGSFAAGGQPFAASGQGEGTITKENNRITVAFADGHREYFTADRQNHMLTIQGQWWYRGVYSLKSNNGATTITLGIYNAAAKFRWAAALMVWPEKNKHKRLFDDFVNRLERSL